jgi:2,3-bisphosphoglycerate-dependent phosphoglycerate mutase
VSITTELLFIRHGQTDWNVQQRFQGQLDVPLNANGQAQAQALASRLANDPHELVFSSDLQRATQTAAPLAAAWSRPVATQPGFREQSFGVLEGLNAQQARDQHPAHWQAWLQQRADYGLPGGESAQMFFDRVMAAVTALVTTHPGRRIAVVTHGGVLDMLWRSAHLLSLDGQRECEIPNTGINRMQWLGDAGGTLRVVQWADDAHVPQAGLWASPRP